MTLDVGAILDLAGPYVASAIDTGGCTVSIERPAAGGRLAGPADPDTLVVTQAAGTVVGEFPALVISQARQAPALGLPAAPIPQGVVTQAFLKPDVVDVHPGDVLTVTRSRDPRLTGQRFAVQDVPDGFAGVARVLTLLPIRGA